MKITQRYKSTRKREEFYPSIELKERLTKKSTKTGKSKSLIICEILEKHL